MKRFKKGDSVFLISYSYDSELKKMIMVSYENGIISAVNKKSYRVGRILFDTESLSTEGYIHFKPVTTFITDQLTDSQMADLDDLKVRKKISNIRENIGNYDIGIQRKIVKFIEKITK